MLKPRRLLHVVVLATLGVLASQAALADTPAPKKPVLVAAAPTRAERGLLSRQLALTLTPATLNGKPYTGPGPIVVPVAIVASGNRVALVGKYAPHVVGVTTSDGIKLGYADGSMVLDGKGSASTRYEGAFRVVISASEVYTGSFAIEGSRMEPGVGVSSGIRAPSTSSWNDAGLSSGWNSGGPTNWNKSPDLFGGPEQANLGGMGWASDEPDGAAAAWEKKNRPPECADGGCNGTPGAGDLKTNKPPATDNRNWFEKQWDNFKKKIDWGKTPVDDLGRSGGGTGTLAPLGGGVRPGGGDPSDAPSSGTGGRSGANGSYVNFKPRGGDDPFERQTADRLNANKLVDPASDPLFARMASIVVAR